MAFDKASLPAFLKQGLAKGKGKEALPPKGVLPKGKPAFVPKKG